MKFLPQLMKSPSYVFAIPCDTGLGKLQVEGGHREPGWRQFCQMWVGGADRTGQTR